MTARIRRFTSGVAGEETNMTDERKKLRDELKARIEDAVGESTNVASAINIGKGRSHTSVSSRQRVVHRDGVTTTVTERREHKSNEDGS
jgi:hypothetical protein